jgi:hypothetical protein
MESTYRVVYEGNSIISIETLPDYPDPVVVKRPSVRSSMAFFVLICIMISALAHAMHRANRDLLEEVT